MSEKLSTTNIPASGGGVPKTLQPGNVTCQVLSVELKPFNFKEGAFEIHVGVEGPAMGDDFQGFFLDKTNESVGRYKGQIGRVKATEWAFADSVTKGGVKISRDMEIMKWLNSFCEAIGQKAWMTAQDNKHATIESLVNAFTIDKPFKGLSIDFCLAGKEYINKGYTNHDLFCPKFTKAGVPFELTGTIPSKLAIFNEATHIVKKKVETTATFTPKEEATTGVVGAAKKDFEL